MSYVMSFSGTQEITLLRTKSNAPTHEQIRSSREMQLEIAKRAATSAETSNMTRFDSSMTRDQIIEKMRITAERVSKR